MTRLEHKCRPALEPWRQHILEDALRNIGMKYKLHTTVAEWQHYSWQAQVIHENITYSVAKKIPWHIYNTAQCIDFPALCLCVCVCVFIPFFHISHWPSSNIRMSTVLSESRWLHQGKKTQCTLVHMADFKMEALAMRWDIMGLSWREALSCLSIHFHQKPLKR